MLTRALSRAFIVVASALMILSPAISQEIEPFVVVPDAPPGSGGGVRVNGCFRATQDLFGPYRLTMCLERRGTYQVRGGGLRCDGRLTHRTVGRDILIELQRASCGRGRAWEAASVECRHTGRLIIQIVPRLSTLSCRYFPTVRGVSPRNFTARRI